MKKQQDPGSTDRRTNVSGRAVVFRSAMYRRVPRARLRAPFLAAALCGLLLLTGCGRTLVVKSGNALPDEQEKNTAAARESFTREAPPEEPPGEPPAGESAPTRPAAEETAGPADPLIYVHVTGAVQKPGVYALAAGARVFLAVEAAGGFSADADREWCNQAQALLDEDKLVIPTLAQTQALAQGGGGPEEGLYGVIRAGTAQLAGQISADGTGNPGAAPAAEGGGPVNLNTAGVQELMTLPGIGQTRAQDIIAYREMNGGFSSVEELTNVSGIGSKMLEKIAGHACV